MDKKEFTKTPKNKVILIVSCVLFICLLFFSTIFAMINMNNEKIISGIRIEGINVSGLSKEEAKNKVNEIYNKKLKTDVVLKYEDYETSINPELVGTKYDVDKSIDEAITFGKGGNIFANNYKILAALIVKKNIKVKNTFDDNSLSKIIDDVQGNLPGAVVEPDYYIENDKLIITKGSRGKYINKDELISKIKENFEDINSTDKYINIPVIEKEPDNIDIEKIHTEIYKEVKDASYTKDPFKLYPEVIGIDFSVDDAKKLLEEDKEKYEIPLTITQPKVTIKDIGSEAFPELIAKFSTRYDGGMVDRETNLKLACSKLDEKIVLPGETFSYNQTLGERTAQAGYKNAKVYENGAVVDGIGGGICQISSTLYNAVLLSNMEIVERRNHQFVTSYLPAGRDATVAYGITDFKFKNTRSTAIKIKTSCSNGVATISIYGIKEQEEYDVSFVTEIISTTPFTVKYIEDSTLKSGEEEIIQKGANGVTTETYIIKKLNGVVASKELLSKDTYNPMQRIIKRGKTANIIRKIHNCLTTVDFLVIKHIGDVLFLNIGDSSRFRTEDLQIKSLLLYQLS